MMRVGDVTPEVTQEEGTLMWQVVYGGEVLSCYETREEAERDLQKQMCGCGGTGYFFHAGPNGGYEPCGCGGE